MDAAPAAMKKTLYQILGVDPKASTQEIEAVYSVRVEELKMDTIQDPNKLVILQQSKEILCDPAQRAAYDVSISGPVAGAPFPADEDPERTFIQQWGKWIVAGVVLIGVVVLWPRHDAAPPTQKPPPKQVASVRVEPPAQSGERAAVPAEPKNVAPPVQSPTDTSADPVLGEWSCTDAISGRTGKYSFRPDGDLSIASSGGPALALKYQVSGNILTLTEPKQAGTLTIEELVARKMILNTGAEGRRLVCTR